MKKTVQAILMAVVLMAFAGCVLKDRCFADRNPRHIVDLRNGYLSLEALENMRMYHQLAHGDTVSFYAQILDIETVSTEYWRSDEDFVWALDYDNSQESRDSMYLIRFSKYHFDTYVAKTGYTDSVLANKANDTIYLTCLMNGACEGRLVDFFQNFVYDNKKIFFKDEEE